MQKEIKLKAWDKIHQRMITEDEITAIYPKSKTIEILGIRGTLCYVDYIQMRKKFESDVILLQFTGLHDKKGKEIYEGDICIVSLSYFDIKNEKSVVIFHNGAFQFQYGCERFFSKPYDAWDEVEVIGNIYENPELLNGYNIV